jgi:hypothetical protein
VVWCEEGRVLRHNIQMRLFVLVLEAGGGGGGEDMMRHSDFFECSTAVNSLFRDLDLSKQASSQTPHKRHFWGILVIRQESKAEACTHPGYLFGNLGTANFRFEKIVGERVARVGT